MEALGPETGKQFAKAGRNLRPEEAAVVGLLQHRLATEGTRLQSTLKTSLRWLDGKGRKAQPPAGPSGSSSSDSFAE